MNKIASGVSGLLACVCGAIPAVAQERNVVIVLLDDVGTDFLSLFGELNPYFGTPPDTGAQPLNVQTPRLEQLAANGVTFLNAYAMPRCSPTRASLYTGNYPVRHGVGNLVFPEHEGDLREFGDPGYASPTIATLATGAPYADALIGKWHLGMADAQMDPQYGSNCYLGWSSIPDRGGWTTFRCLFRGVTSMPKPPGGEGPIGAETDWYRNYYLSRNETVHAIIEAQGPETVFESVVVFDEARDWCTSQTGRFMCVIAPNAPHSPWQFEPPDNLVNTLAYQEVPTNAFSRHAAMLEALDTKLGDFLDGLEAAALLDDTLIIVMGDNGSESVCLAHAGVSNPEGSGMDLGPVYNALLGAPEERFKGSVYEKGIRVPLIVAGPGIQDPGRSSRALVDITDIYPTVAEVMGVEAGDVNGQSFLTVLEDSAAAGPRDFVYAEIFSPLGSTEPGRVFDERRIGCSLRVPSGERYKVVRDQDLGEDRLYRLEDQNGDFDDPWELIELDYSVDGPVRDAYLALVAKIQEISDSGLATDGTPCGNVLSFCPAEPNSTGVPAKISIAGSRSLCANVLDLKAENLPVGQPGLFFYSQQTTAQIPFGDGQLCIGGAVVRMPAIYSNLEGKLTFSIDVEDLPTGIPFEPSSIWHFQFWYRDPFLVGGEGFNLTNALSLTFCP